MPAASVDPTRPATWDRGSKQASSTEKQCRPLGERGAHEETFVIAAAPAVAPATATAVAAAAVNIEDVFETDMDLMMDADEGEEPEEQGEEEGEEKVAEAKSADSDMKEGTPKPKAASSSSAAAAAAAAVKSLAPSSLRWFYTDPAGEEHGPYTAVSMLRWHRAGFFAFNDTPLRRADEDNAGQRELHTRSNAPPTRLDDDAHTFALACCVMFSSSVRSHRRSFVLHSCARSRLRCFDGPEGEPMVLPGRGRCRAGTLHRGADARMVERQLPQADAASQTRSVYRNCEATIEA